VISILWPWAVLGVIVLFYAAIRMRFLAIPLERDEGEYAYAGQLLLQGIPPYELVYSMKLPGIYYAYAMIMAIFGQSVVAVHVGLLLINSFSIVLVFLLGSMLADDTVGLVSAAAFGFLTINAEICGVQAHATHFVVVFALWGILRALEAAESGSLRGRLLSGALLGFAVTMKQHGVLFVLLMTGYLLWHELARRKMPMFQAVARTLVLPLASLIPLLATGLLMLALGVFDRFWFWTVDYASQYASGVPLRYALQGFSQSTWAIMQPSFCLWTLAGLGLVLQWADPTSRRHAGFMTAFFLASFLTICPGFYFREHYYVTWMPAMALAIGMFVGAGRNLLQALPAPRFVAAIPTTLTLTVLAATIHSQRAFLFDVPILQASRMMYGTCPWVETREIAEYIRQRTRPDDTIAVLGSEPQTYFYANRKSATGYMYTYALMEPHKYASNMQRQMIAEIERAKPSFLVIVAMEKSWLPRPDSDMTIFNWQSRYAGEHYDLVGVAWPTLIGSQPDAIKPQYLWGEDAKRFQPQAGVESIYVFERKKS